MSNKQCTQCGLVNWASATECKRCRTLLDVQETPQQDLESSDTESSETESAETASSETESSEIASCEAAFQREPFDLESLAPPPTHIFSGGVKFLSGVLALEVMAIFLSRVLHVLDGDTARGIAGLFMLAGFVLMFLTHIWMVIRIFEQSMWWGLGTLFIPLVGLFAVAQFWQKTKRSFVGQLICVGILFVGFLIVPESSWPPR